MREEFEKWLLEGVAEQNKQELVKRQGESNYWHPHVQCAWTAWQHQQKEIDRLTTANKSLNAEATELDVLMPRTDWENDMREARLALVKLAPKDRDAIIRLISTPDHIPDAEPCPNCDSLVKEMVNLRHELNMAHLLIVDLYNSAHREGWEPGESTEELCDRTHSYLCNWGLDPYTNGGPKRIKQLRKAIAPPSTEPKDGE